MYVFDNSKNLELDISYFPMVLTKYIQNTRTKTKLSVTLHLSNKECQPLDIRFYDNKVHMKHFLYALL